LVPATICDRPDLGILRVHEPTLRCYHQAGAPVWSLKEPWTETADRRLAELLGALYAWIAAEESRRRSERVKAGLARRKTDGKPVGRRAGSQDRKPRKRSGYYARWERERTMAS
jgi:DNA invertase Pin-like site-specific DNA recombinase